MTGLRLRHLDLTRYGHFDGLRLEFGPARACDVTVIYGDNEAGKSTAFTAWLDLLFDFKRQNHPYAFRFERRELEVGALLDTDQGPLELRRTGRGLLDGAGHPLEELRLAPLRAGLDREAFARRFSLDDLALRAGGSDIAAGKGDLGEALHVGTSGRAGLGPALRALQERADAFHRKGGRTTGLKAAKDRLRTLEAEIAAAELPPEGWDRLQAARANAEAAVTAAKADLATARRAADLCQRAAHLRDLDAKLAGITAALADLPEGPDLPQGAEGRHAAARTSLDHAADALGTAQANETRQREVLAGLGLPDPPPVTTAWLDEALRLLQAASEADRARAEAESLAQERAEAIPEGPETELDLSELETLLAALPDPARIGDAQDALAQDDHALARATLGLDPDWPDRIAQGLPEDAEVAAVVDAVVEARREARAETEALAEAQAETATRARAVKAAQALPDHVTAAQRDAARAARDAAWDRHRQTLDASSADAFAAAMRQDDAMQGRFAAGETARLRLAQAQEALDEARDALDTAGRRAAEAQAREQAAATPLAAMARRLGLPADGPPSALQPRLDRLRAAGAARLARDRAADHATGLARAEQAGMARLADLLGPGEDLRARADQRLRTGAGQNALWASGQTAARRHQEAVADARLRHGDAARSAAALRDHLSSAGLGDWPLDRLRAALPPLSEWATAVDAAQTARQAAKEAQTTLAAVLAGQGSDQIEPLLARDRLRADRAELTRRRAELIGADAEALAQEAAQDDPARAQRLETEVIAAETALSDAQTALGAAQRDLEAAGQGTEADRLRQARANCLARLERDARTALVASLGARIGQRALARHQAETRGALLDATQEAFARLTRGGWPRLVTDNDGKGGQVLYAVDEAGRTRIDQLSTGTQGQLYLALRLAGYGLFARQQGALPFVLDDVAETFDDARAREALTMLGELGQTGQAIFLTHHRHLVEMARAVLPDLHVIDLPARPAG